MRLIRTAKIKLDIPVDEVLPTLVAYTKAFNFVCQEGFQHKERNGINLHKLCYQTTRAVSHFL
jgi:predicted transposase